MNNTTTTTHTPGPWTAYAGTVFTGTREEPTHIARIAKGQIGERVVSDRDERRENARLIAACPDLLKALQEVYKWGQRSEHERQQNGPMLKDYLRQAAETAHAAIAKAGGAS